MKVIRRGVFETNSSSTHSISIVTKEDYDKWEEGEMLKCGSKFYTREEAIKELKEDEYFIKYNPNFDFTDEEAVNEALEEEDYKTSDQYFNSGDLESFEKTFTTKSGDTIVAFGKYGYNG